MYSYQLTVNIVWILSRFVLYNGRGKYRLSTVYSCMKVHVIVVVIWHHVSFCDHSTNNKYIYIYIYIFHTNLNSLLQTGSTQLFRLVRILLCSLFHAIYVYVRKLDGLTRRTTILVPLCLGSVLMLI